MAEHNEKEALTIPEIGEGEESLEWLFETLLHPFSGKFEQFVAKIGPGDLRQLQQHVENAASLQWQWNSNRQDGSAKYRLFNRLKPIMQQCLQERGEALQQQWEAGPKLAELPPNVESLMQLAMEGNLRELQETIEGMDAEKRKVALELIIRLNEQRRTMNLVLSRGSIPDPTIPDRSLIKLYTALLQ